MLAELRTPDGEPVDLALTTNGSALRALARPLADAGLRRITVSLDSLDDDVFRRMNGVDFPVDARARRDRCGGRGGARPIKINVVLKRGENEGGILAACALGARRTATSCGSSSTWTSARPTAGGSTRSCPAEEVVETISRRLAPRAGGRRATGARSPSAGATPTGRGEIGVIASVTRPFCGDCTRARVSAEGKLYTCLFSAIGHDLRDPLRAGDSTTSWPTASPRSGRAATTATPSAARRRPSASRRSRCSPSAADSGEAGGPRGVVHELSTPVRNSWTDLRVPGRISWITSLTRPLPGFVRYVLPEGAARERGTEITSRTSSQGRSLRALLYPVATAFLRRPREARRDAIGIPVSILSSGPQKPAGHRPSTPGRSSGGPHAGAGPGPSDVPPVPPSPRRSACAPRRARGCGPRPVATSSPRSGSSSAPASEGWPTSSRTRSRSRSTTCPAGPRRPRPVTSGGCSSAGSAAGRSPCSRAASTCTRATRRAW